MTYSNSPITSENYYRIFNVVSLICIFSSLLITIFVLTFLAKKRVEDKHKEKDVSNPLTRHSSQFLYIHNQNQYIFQRLTHYTITCLIVSDLLFEIAYIPTAVLRFIYVSYYGMDKMAQITLTCFSEIAEFFFTASGVWSLFITLCIYLAIRNMNTDLRPRSFTATATVRGRNVQYRTSVGGTTSVVSSPSLASNPNEDRYEDDEETSSLSQSKRGFRNSNYYTQVEGIDKVKSVEEQQQDLTLAYARVHRVKRLYKFLFAFVAWGIPFFFLLAWIALNEYSIFATVRNQIILSLVNDSVKTLCYVILELCTIFFRILIYFTVRNVHGQIIFSESSPNYQRKKQEQRKVFKQMTFFSLPFVICGLVLIIYRVSFDIESIAFISKPDAKLAYSPFIQVLIGIHTILFPLRGALDGVTYCFVSKWFLEQVGRACTVVSRRSKEEQKKALMAGDSSNPQEEVEEDEHEHEF